MGRIESMWFRDGCFTLTSKLHSITAACSIGQENKKNRFEFQEVCKGPSPAAGPLKAASKEMADKDDKVKDAGDGMKKANDDLKKN